MSRENAETRELIFLNALNSISIFGARRLTALINHFGSAVAAWEADPEDYSQVIELADKLELVKTEKKQIDPEQEWNKMVSLDIKCITPLSREYPALLKQTPFPSPILYYRGSMAQINQPAVAIVGSRRCTFYGKEVSGRLAADLAAAGVGVVSGMALGVDTAAHLGALDNNGYTVAVLGCGLSRCYPPRNKKLMEQIASTGAVVSEFSLNSEPLAINFPQRNRIISALSLGTVVVEATAKSGALITAGYALEQNREVFAVPGNVGSPYSRGCHRLIKEGACLVESVEDILGELYIDCSGERQLSLNLADEPSLTGPEKDLLQIIPYQPMHIDQIIKSSGRSAAEIVSLLLSLELKKKISQTPGKYFCRT